MPGSRRAATTPSAIVRRTRGRWPSAPGHRRDPDQGQGHQDGPEADNVEPERPGQPAGGDDQPGQGGADDPAQVVLGRPQAHRPEQVVGADQVGGHGLDGRHGHGKGAPGQEHDRGHGGHRQPVGRGQHGQQDRQQRLEQGHPDQEAAAVEAVGERAPERPQQDRRHVGEGGHRARPGRLAGGLGDVDPDGHRLHPGADVGDEAPRPDGGERAVPERAERRHPVRVGGAGHPARLPSAGQPRPGRATPARTRRSRTPRRCRPGRGCPASRSRRG